VLADPAHGALRHHKENAITVATYFEALELVGKGFPIRMSDGAAAPSLVAPTSLEFIDAPVKRIDDLWNYTMPETPFPFEEVEKGLRQHIFSQSSDIGWIADPSAASAFIGFPFDPFDPFEDSENRDPLDRIDLERFNITRIARAAYASAFRPWPSNQISEEDVDELEQIITASLTQFGRRHPSPLDNEESPLFRTLMAAYYRWQIADGCFLADEKLDQNAMVAVCALTGMPAAAVRNALSREGISTVKAKLDRKALLEWITARRNFAPLREDEKPIAQWTWRVINALTQQPMTEAFSKIRAMLNISTDLAEIEQELAKCAEAGRVPPDALLLRYAKALNIQPDTFILAMRSRLAKD